MSDDRPVSVDEVSRRTTEAARAAHEGGKRSGVHALLIAPTRVFLRQLLRRRTGIHRARLAAIETFLAGAKLWELDHLPESEAVSEDCDSREHHRH